MDKQKTKLIAELNIAIEQLEADIDMKAVVTALDNAIQGIMDTMEVQELSWFDQAQLLCHGRVI